MLLESLDVTDLCVVSASSYADVKACISSIFTRLQKMYEFLALTTTYLVTSHVSVLIYGLLLLFFRFKTSARASSAVKVVVMGCDWFVNWVLMPYVDMFSAISADFLSLVHFLLVPLGKYSL